MGAWDWTSECKMGNRWLRARVKCVDQLDGVDSADNATESRQFIRGRGAGIYPSCCIRKLENPFLVTFGRTTINNYSGNDAISASIYIPEWWIIPQHKNLSVNKSLCVSFGQRKKIIPPTCLHFYGPFALFFRSFQQPLQSSCRNPWGQSDPT